jgi:transcriptional regulator with XRE-family HTH domain
MRRPHWPVSEPPLDAATVAARLQAAMAAQQLTLSALAAQSGVAPLVIRELLRGQTQSRNPLTLVKLAQALGQPWDWLGAAPPPTIPAGASHRLYAARLAKGWTLDDLAAASHVHRRTIQNLEHGSAGTERTWADLARALGVALADWVGDAPIGGV